MPFPGCTTNFFVQPRTLVIDLQRNIGSNGTQSIPHAAH